MPSPALRPFVECVWTLEGRGASEGNPQPVFPAAVGALFRTAASTLTGRVVELCDLLGSEGDDLVDTIRAAATCHDRTRVLEMFLEARVRRVTSPDPLTAAAAGLIDRSGGGAKIDRVARAVGLSPRHLQRRFVEAVGVAPKQYARIVRFQKALGLLDLGASLTRTALLCGYYDQPHFSRSSSTSPASHPSTSGEAPDRSPGTSSTTRPIRTRRPRGPSSRLVPLVTILPDRSHRGREAK